jgi:rhamnose transport system permease protein
MVTLGPAGKRRLAQWASLGGPLVLLGAMLIINGALRKPTTWERIGRNWAGNTILALAMTPILITGGIDLSVGSVVGLSAVVAGVIWHEFGFSLAAALACCVLAGLAAGVVNGSAVVSGISPLVVTLATLAVFRGLAYGLAGDHYCTDFPPALSEWWEGASLGLPHPVWLVLGVFVFMYALVHHTWMGRMLFAIGDNVQAARFAAVPVRTLTFGLYALSGLLAGMVGLTGILEFRAAPPSQGEGLELRAIACAVLGGVRVTGGAGHVGGTLLGTLTLAALLEGLAGVPARWRLVLLGGFLVTVAVGNEALARWRQATR